MKMIRTFHPVGHGAFYTERFYDDNDDNIANVVFDCGCFEPGKNPVCKNRIRAIVDKTFSENCVIDALFVSHFHIDHINGIQHLMNRCDVKKIYIPYLPKWAIIESYLFNCIAEDDVRCGANELIEAVYNNRFDAPCELIEGAACVKILCASNWCYKMFTPKTAKRTDFLSKIKQKMPGVIVNNTIDFNKLKEIIKRQGIEFCRDIYAEIYNCNHNSYSLTLFSGSCLRPVSHNCLYMGDYKAKGKLTELKNFYQEEFLQIGILQVPHHGSEHNLNDALYREGMECIISSGTHDYYKHPDPKTVMAISNSGAICHIITEISQRKDYTIVV